jgi:branched-chain amino acid transport system ATP-binding protein
LDAHAVQNSGVVATPTRTSSVELTHVVKAFGAFRAVDDVSLAFLPGETVGVVGPNGAGKTTLFGLISGAHRVTGGRVHLMGADVTAMGPLQRAERGVSRTFQTARVFPALTVKEHLLLAVPDDNGRRLRWTASRVALSSETNERLQRVASAYALDDVLHLQAANLPQAQRKILDLAMALLRNPDVLLLDEPTAGVATEDLAVIQSLMGELRQRHPDMTIILSSHDADLIARLCSRIVVLVRGKVLADGPTDEVVNDARVRAAYFGDVLDA